MRRLLPVLLGLALTAVGVPVARAAASPSPSPAPASPSPVPAPDPLAQQLQQALQQQQAIDATKQALSGEVQAAKDQQQNLGALIVANRKAIADTIAQMAVAEQKFQDATIRQGQAQADAAEARRREVDDKALLAAYIRQRYMTEDTFVSYLLAADSFSDLMSRASMLAHISSSGATLLQQVRADEARAAAAEAQAAADAAAAQQAAAALAAQKQDLDRQTARDQDLVQQLGDQVDAANTEIKQADSQDAALAQQIAALRIQQLDQAIAAAEQAAWDEATYYIQHHLLGLPPGMVVDAQHPASVRFVWPVPGSTFTQQFGPSPYTFEPAAFGYPHFHTGIDMAAPMGTPVIAAGDGVVVAATAGATGYGNHIIIAHDQHTLTLYGHLQSMLVKPGDTVHQGQLIGLLGSTGNSTGPHTHFEVRIDNVPADPTPFLPALPPGATGPPALSAPTS